MSLVNEKTSNNDDNDHNKCSIDNTITITASTVIISGSSTVSWVWRGFSLERLFAEIIRPFFEWLSPR